MKGLVLLNDGFEDTELIATIDVLKRGKFSITLASMKEDLMVNSQYNVLIKADELIKNINLDDYDFLMIPGGKAVVNYLSKDERVFEIIHYFANKKLVCAICAAPSIIGKLGYYKDIEYTVFPGFEEGIEGIHKNQGVVVSDKFITAKSMYYSIEFALAIYEYFMGKECKKQLLKQLMA